MERLASMTYARGIGPGVLRHDPLYDPLRGGPAVPGAGGGVRLTAGCAVGRLSPAVEA